ncbi:MAG TPA: putative metal-binding motif-containing protein [Myxococcota bacterium]|nr:putative metal-binding motif-containing protein [Myxococcota bacterium]
MIWLFACTKGSVEVPDQTDDSTPAVVDSEIEDTGCLHTTYFPDEDGDGYGDEDLPTESCEPIIGAVIVGGDCDDGDFEIGPDVEEECGDGFDNDCDGEIDEAAEGCEEAPEFSRHAVEDAVATVLGREGDGFGDHISVMDQDGDGEFDLLGLQLELGDENLAHLFHGPLSGTRPLGSADRSFGDEPASSAILVSDRDGDGLADVVLGDTSDADESIYLIESAGWGAQDPVPSGPAQWAGPDQEHNYFGYALYTGGDFDGDGLDDLAVGAPYDNEGGSQAGAVYLWVGDWTYLDPNIKFIGERWPDDYAIGWGYGTFGDIGGDGYDDLLVPSARFSSGSLRGRVCIQEGGVLSEASTVDSSRCRGIYGDPDDPLDDEVVVLGDLDGDAAEELAVVTESGVVLIYSGFDVAGGDTRNHFVGGAAARIESRYAGEGGPWTQLVGDRLGSDEGRLMVSGVWADSDEEAQLSVFLFDAQTVYGSATSRLADAESAWIGGFERVDDIEGFGEQVVVGDSDADDGRGAIYVLSP